MAKRTDETIPLEEAQKRRRKKKKPIEPDNTALNQQVADDDTITIADVKQFITDAKKKQQDWKLVADRSWNEIEKRNRDGKLYGGNDLYANRRWTRFPLWWSCLKIRQPLTLARLPEPVLKDTQSDDDPFGNTACILGERLIKSALKTFEIYPEFESGRDDFLVTNFAWGRPYYRMTEVQEDEKIRLQVIQPPPEAPPVESEGMQPPSDPNQPEQGNQLPPMPQMPPIFVTPDGQQIPQEQVQEDDLGPYFLTGNEITVDNEEIYWEAGLYPNLIVDPFIRKWNKVNELAFEFEYSYNEFKEKFGKDAFELLAQGDKDDHRKKGKPIIVFEYWNKFYKECRWFAENSNDFFQPIAMVDIDDLEEVSDSSETQGTGQPDNSDLYGLPGFFPCTEPLSINQSTKHFWPTPEYFQVCDIIDDIHSIVGRMIQLTKAIRIRFFFDSSVTELSTLIGENWAMGEGTGMGIPDLETTLMNNKGSLSNLVAYFPVDDLVNGLKNMYDAFQQRLDMFYQITGISDLIRGQTNPDSDKTFGERQMEGKYALNRVEPFQNKIQIWIKNNYELILQMELSMFSDETIDDYITPQTLDDEHKGRYEAALELLKDNRRRRFRVDFETDSTIAINEEWKKAKAIETANTISKMIESTAQVVKDQPEIGAVELKLMKHVVGDLVDGKLFIDEIQSSIQDAIDQAKQPKPPAFDKDKAANDLATRQLDFDEQRAMTEDKLQQMSDQMTGQIEEAKVAQTTQIAQLKAQVDQFKIQADNQIKMQQLAEESQKAQADLQLHYQKINADITTKREEMSLERDGLLVEMKKIASQSEVDQFSNMIDARVAQYEKTLGTAQQELEQTKVLLTAHLEAAQQTRLNAEEIRLEREHAMDLHTQKIEALHTVVETALKHKELIAPPEKEVSPIKKGK